jgi:predicted RNase H-like HicB family nuclease
MQKINGPAIGRACVFAFGNKFSSVRRPEDETPPKGRNRCIAPTRKSERHLGESDCPCALTDFDNVLQLRQEVLMTRQLTASISKEGKWFVAQCLEVDVASQGKTEKQALKNLQEALELYLEEPTATKKPKIVSLNISVNA